MRFTMNDLRELLCTIHIGLWVLWVEIRWLVGADRTFRSRLDTLRQRQLAVQAELARLTTLADPRRRQLDADLSLLDEDLARLEIRQENQRMEYHQTLRTRFAL